MPAVSKKQQRFFGIIRAIKKGVFKGKKTPEIQRAASSISDKDSKKMASTKHEGLPEKIKEDYVKELEDGLCKMDYPAYDEVDKLMKKIAKDNNIDTTTLHMAFKTKHLMVPDDWAKKKMMEPVMIPKTPVNEISLPTNQVKKKDNPYSADKKLKMIGTSIMDRVKQKARSLTTVHKEGNDLEEKRIIPSAEKRLYNRQKTDTDQKDIIKARPGEADKQNKLIDRYSKKYKTPEEKNETRSFLRGIARGEIQQEGQAYGFYKGDGKPKGAMKAYLEKKKKEKKEVKEEQNPEGIKYSDKKKLERQEQLKKASEKAPVVTNKIVPTSKLKTEGILPDIILQKKIPLGDKDNLILSAKEKKKKETQTEGSLHKWFKGSKSKDGKGGWVNVVTGGTCASDEPGEGTPKCVSSSKRASMTKAERKSAASRKKRKDPGQQSKSGAAKPTYVSTDKPKKKVNEAKVDKLLPDHKRSGKRLERYGNPHGSLALGGGIQRDRRADHAERRGKKTKGLITASFMGILEDAKMQRQTDDNLDALRKKFGGMDQSSPANQFMAKRIQKEIDRRKKQKKKEIMTPTVQIKDNFMPEIQEDCWDGYEKKGMKTMFGKRYPNCVKKKKTRKEEYVMEKSCGDRDEYGDKKGGPTISAKDKKKNLSSNTKDEFSNNESYSSNDAMQAAIAIAKKNRKQDLKVAEKKKISSDYKPDMDMIEDYHSGKGEINVERTKKFMDKKGMKGAPGLNAMIARQEEHKANRGKKKVRTEEVKMTRAAYKKLHPDFKSDDPKNPRTTKYEKGKGTVSHPVTFTDEYVPEAKKPMVKVKLKDPSKIKVKVTDIGAGGKEYVRKDEMQSEAAAWTRKAGKNQSGGLNEKGRKSYERENPGSDLKAPSKKKGNKRRASFCARMKGMKSKLTSAKTARDPDSRINKSLRAWNCSYEPDKGEVISETMLSAIRRKKEVLNQSQTKKTPKKAMDAGARLRRKKQREEHRKYVNDIIPDHLKDEYMPIIEGKNKCGKGEYYCNDDKKCKPIPKGYRIGYGGYLKPENKEDESNGKKGGSNGNGNGNGGNGNGHGGNGNGGNGGGDGGGE